MYTQLTKLAIEIFDMHPKDAIKKMNSASSLFRTNVFSGTGCCEKETLINFLTGYGLQSNNNGDIYGLMDDKSLALVIIEFGDLDTYTYHQYSVGEYIFTPGFFPGLGEKPVIDTVQKLKEMKLDWAKEHGWMFARVCGDFRYPHGYHIIDGWITDTSSDLSLGVTITRQIISDDLKSKAVAIVNMAPTANSILSFVLYQQDCSISDLITSLNELYQGGDHRDIVVSIKGQEYYYNREISKIITKEAYDLAELSKSTSTKVVSNSKPVSLADTPNLFMKLKNFFKGINI